MPKQENGGALGYMTVSPKNRQKRISILERRIYLQTYDTDTWGLTHWNLIFNASFTGHRRIG
jgi:hypothetical protein